MRTEDTIKSLVDLGFTTPQSLALASIALGLRSGVVSLGEVEKFLETAGFPDKTAMQLSETFFRILAANDAA